MSYRRAVALGVAAAVVSLLGVTNTPEGGDASASATATTLFGTVSGVLEGEGGQFDEPLSDAITASSPPWGAAGSTADSVQFDMVAGMDQAREDFVNGEADFAVAEGPLTGGGASLSTLPDILGPANVYQNEEGTASLNGLTVAYVPIALEAVAVPFIVGSCADAFTCTLQPTINMSPATLEAAFQGSIPTWSSPAIEADNGGQGFSESFGQYSGPYPANPHIADASNAALINYFLNTPQAASAWDNWALSFGSPAATTLYGWPKKAPNSSANQFDEEDMISDLVPPNPLSLGQPQEMSLWATNYNLTVVPWSWTFPKYTLYGTNLPDISVENEAGAFVEPSYASMEAAFSYGSIDPSSNLVTLTSNATDMTAYPAQMMTTDYVVVPLNGLPPDKATALAGMITYLMSATGQSAICSAGYLPVVQTGLTSSECPIPAPSSTAAALSLQIQSADQAVIGELDNEAAPTTTTSSTTSTSTSTTSTSTTSTSTTTTSTTTTSTTTTSTTTPATTSTTTPTTTTATPTTTNATPTTTTATPTATSSTSSTTAPAAITTLVAGATTEPAAAAATTTVPAAGTTTTFPAAATTTTVPGAAATTTVPAATTTTTGRLAPTTNSTVPASTTPATVPAVTPATTPGGPITTVPAATTTTVQTSGLVASPTTATTVQTSGANGGPTGSGPTGSSPTGPSPEGTLAYTGTDPMWVIGPGLGLLAIGEAARTGLRRRRRHREAPAL